MKEQSSREKLDKRIKETDEEIFICQADSAQLERRK